MQAQTMGSGREATSWVVAPAEKMRMGQPSGAPSLLPYGPRLNWRCIVCNLRNSPGMVLIGA